MDDEPMRSQAARAAAELALVRVVHHYGDRPEFVVLGGLVPQLLCSGAGVAHAGTTDIDVQVDLEIAGGVVNTGRLEQALRNAEFVPDRERVWRWATVADGVRAVVKFELLVDLETEPAGATVIFDDCEHRAQRTCAAPASPLVTSRCGDCPRRTAGRGGPSR